MKIEDTQKPENRDVMITARTTRPKREWMRKNGVSPTRLFNKAIEELMERAKREDDGDKQDWENPEKAGK